MSRYRILYFCMLSMAVSYYVMDTRYLSWLLLVMILLLVPLEVLLSLPGLLTLRIKHSGASFAYPRWGADRAGGGFFPLSGALCASAYAVQKPADRRRGG